MDADTIRMSADEVISWLRKYAAGRINSNLIDERRCIPPYVVLDFGNRGLLGLRVPRRYGGLELTQADAVRVLEQLGAIDLTLATFLLSHAHGVHTIQKYGCSVLQEELLSKLASGREISAFALTEPGAGSNPRAIQTQAVPDSRGGWVLNGEKYLVDSGSWASVITVFARTSDEARESSSISAFAVRQGTPGLVIGGESLTMGLRGMAQNTMTLRDVRVGAESLLGLPGAGTAIIQDTLSLARLNLAAKSIGAIKRCLQLMHRYASRRPVATGMLWDNPVTQSRMAEFVSAVTAVEALIGRIARNLDAGEEVPTEAFLACKVAGSEYLWKAADALVQVLGGRGYVETNVAPQILRDARSFLLSEGPTETLLMYLGSRVIHVGNDLERFIAVALGSPHIADRLNEIIKQIRARCSNESAGIREPNDSYWASWLVGEVAMWAILLAAVENSDLKGHELAQRWAYSKFKERIAALTEDRLTEWAVGRGKTTEDLIAGYTESIGDAEQTLPVPITELDLLLRRSKPPPLREDRGLSAIPEKYAGGDGEEQDLVVYGWNETVSSYPKDLCIHQLFERQVAHAPERLAAVCAGEALSYGELNARADRLARKLRQMGVSRAAPVGLCVERSLDLLVSLLGILKAGGAYMPLDATHPRRRLAQILDETGVPVIVAHPHLAAMLPEHAAQVVHPDAWGEVEPFEKEEIDVEARAEQSAYVMYTSGSTGRPKGVEVSHRSVVNFLCSMRERPGFSENDVLVAVTTISFDIAALELLLPLVTGGRVVLASRRTALDGTELAKLIEESGATVFQATPATWRMLLASGWQGRPNLKALCGGESLPRKLARSIQTRTASLWNLYGPTETTIWSCIERVTDDSDPIAIGRPIANTHVYLLNEDLEPVPVGVPGEIFIGGEGVAEGYWKRPDLTAERFLPDPFRPGERMYRTGDRARFLLDGRIEYLGRLDQQVKIRGFRIELGEIEAALMTHEAVREVAVVAREYAPEDSRLVAYVTLSSGAARRDLIRKLKEHVQDYVPMYMVPSAFVVLDGFPLTPNGKIDRNALPAPRPEDIIYEPNQAPYALPIEEEINRIWSNVLRTATFDREDDFFVLGGHSLLATQVVSQLRESFGVEIPIAMMFERPTVAALTEAVHDALGVVANGPPCPALKPIERSGEFELSFAQQRLWFLSQLDPSSAQYHVPVALRLDGPVEVELMRSVFEKLVERHEALRARFESRDGQPLQVIEPAESWSLPILDLESLPEEERQAEVERLKQQEATRPFDLNSGPLLRTTLVRLTPVRHVLLLTTHHIVADGWSVEVLLREVGILYTALSQGRSSPLPPVLIQPADHAFWQRKWLQGGVLEAQLAYWRKQLAGLPVLDLPTDRPDSAEQGDRGATHAFALSAELSAGLRRLAQKQGATIFMTLMAAWQALLSRYTSQEDFGIGFPIANRMWAEVENLIGCFVNTLVLRADLSGDPTYTELLARVRRHALKAYAHQALPFERLVQEFRSPLFRVMFALQNAPAANLTLPELQITRLAATTKTAKFDLTLSVREHEGRLLGDVEYSTDLFEASTIERMLGHFQSLLTAIVAHPERRISHLPILSDTEREQLLAGWNNTERDFSKEKCVHELFEEQVERSPGSVAVVFEDQRLTYRELNQRANRLAHYLQSLGVGPERLVGICLERCTEIVVAPLGVLKAGGAYVPLDPRYPAERLAFMLADAQVPVLLTTHGLLATFQEYRGRIVCLDAASENILTEPEQPPVKAVTPENLAYASYTSGSTGKPKAVAMSHRSLCNLLAWQVGNFMHPGPARSLQFASLSFDVSFQEIFATFCSGGALVLIPETLRRDPVGLLHYLRDQSVERLFVTFTALQQLAEAARDGNPVPESLREIITAGEQLQITPPIISLFNQLADATLHNQYGPSESHVVTAFTLTGRTDAWSPLPSIGRPISNTQIFLLDQSLNPLPIGVYGELYIGGEGLARGYLNRPELTAEKFIPSPFSSQPGARLYRTGDLARYLPDGRIEFLGRSDNQVKIRGFRIELGEIESALAQHARVRKAVVTTKEDSVGGKQLIAYIVPHAGAPTTSELRNYLKASLPDYMVPSAFVILQSFPLLPSGKVDRKALPDPDRNLALLEQVNVTPRNTVEEIIAGIWAEIVGIKQIGVHENFFDLGGHSLLAMQVISRLRDTFQIELPLRTLFEKPTIEGLAVAIIEKQAEGVAAEQVSGILAEMELQSEEEIERQLKYEGKTGA